MFRRVVLPLLVLSTLALISCGRSTDVSMIQGAGVGGDGSSSPERHLIVVSGGYGSCPGSKLAEDSLPWNGVARVRRALVERGETAQFIVTCFGKDDFSLAQLGESRQVARRFGGWDDWYRYLEAEIAARPGSRLHLIGHSHGGFLAMASVAELARVWGDRLPVETSLTTVDPIDYYGCRENEVFWSTVGGLLFEPVAACTRAPAWIASRVPAERLRSWSNFFQTDFDLVHSGAIRGATNWRLPMRHTGPKAHKFTSDDARVWIDVARRL